MISRCISQKWDDKPIILKKKWVSLENINPSLQIAVVASEDQNYLEHEGFDLPAIQDAYQYNKTHKKQRGASTISQQTAKNLFLWPSRSFIRKGFEVYFTILIEIFWSKERILEVYLNIIEMGNGIYGAEAAAQTYFKKSAKNISTFQAAQIASILPNPIKYSINNPPTYIKARQSWILNQIKNLGGELDFEKVEVAPQKETKK